MSALATAVSAATLHAGSTVIISDKGRLSHTTLVFRPTMNFSFNFRGGSLRVCIKS